MLMASSALSLPLHRTLSVHCARNAHSTSSEALASNSNPLLSRANRRQLLFSLTSATVLTARELSSMAEEIPLFGLRKKLRNAEDEAVEIVKEGIETAEKELEAVEKEIESAERETETTVRFGGLAQAGVVAGAEAVGILVASTVVHGILRPEDLKS
ncbi:uncharacterized protein LOC110820023 [Carica papaya]|uniref:uncharacterized protein LOC110820023 n=1 Tax=Carica papaya TaxID=3649 RepID=UPI000B8CF86A|nr:uncharacterized protein LOC110820023 [Carica papaya]